ncbi:hypothetical protein HGH93_15710 [Chitinophaga polysaccharea]|uniref:hypothetical protein n=1 Tax=Chitinophaga polysaccharea TaxID=1293035 RepID=UPI001454FB24|nr:hypothetical protein [Chitinophaga polysaccharea]NLR59559.1 hypothetical protein [Chitinophaga polysaccharea]
MSTVQECPWCGSDQIIRTIPEKDPVNVIIVCKQCQRIVSGTDSNSVARKTNPARQSVEEKVIQLCMNAGKLPAIKYYLTEMNKTPGIPPIGLREAKETVEAILYTRGLSSMVKKPNKNGGVIALIVLVLIVACLVYFFTHR